MIRKRCQNRKKANLRTMFNPESQPLLPPGREDAADESSRREYATKQPPTRLREDAADQAIAEILLIEEEQANYSVPQGATSPPAKHAKDCPPNIVVQHPTIVKAQIPRLVGGHAQDHDQCTQEKLTNDHSPRQEQDLPAERKHGGDLDPRGEHAEDPSTRSKPVKEMHQEERIAKNFPPGPPLGDGEFLSLHEDDIVKKCSKTLINKLQARSGWALVK